MADRTSPDMPELIRLPKSRILRHFMHNDRSSGDTVLVTRQSAESDPPPTFTTPFYLANIGSPEYPLLLELRFEPIAATVERIAPDIQMPEGLDKHVRIALLMTNERYITDLMALGNELYARVRARDIAFDAIVAMESLGPKLSQEVARVVLEREGRNLLFTSFQKGKPRVDDQGNVTVGPPKPWIEESAGIDVNSGTSHPAAKQRLFLDQKVASYIRENNLRVLIIDDARMTQGSINTGVALLRRSQIPIAAVATILNEGEPTDTIDGIPYIGLTKLPLFMPVTGGLRPIPGTYRGLAHFYRELT